MSQPPVDCQGCARHSRVGDGTISTWPARSFLLEDPVVTLPALCSPSSTGRRGPRGDVTAGGTPALSLLQADTPLLRECPRAGFPPSELRGPLGVRFSSGTHPFQHLPRTRGQSERTLLPSCRLRSDLNARVSGDRVLTAPLVKEEHRSLAFSSEKGHVMPFLSPPGSQAFENQK